MLDIESALKNNRILRSLTGFDINRFGKLHADFQKEFLRQLKSGRRKRKLQRAPGGGRPHTLVSTEHKLFFILFYLRVYPTMELSGFLFGVVRSVIFDWVKESLPILEIILETSCDLPKRKIHTFKEFLERFPKVTTVIIDATERPRTRPKDTKKQKSGPGPKKC